MIITVCYFKVKIAFFEISSGHELIDKNLKLMRNEVFLILWLKTRFLRTCEELTSESLLIMKGRVSSKTS
jgi:hypothetical protein